MIPLIDGTLTPGTYFLTETVAPDNYRPISEDIRFTIASNGEVTIDTPTYSDRITVSGTNTADYLISVPNKYITEANLTVIKQVTGNLANKDKAFNFTLTVDGAVFGDEYLWMKNGAYQPNTLHSGSTFTLKNNDIVVITLPKNTNITITEANENYTTRFKLDDGVNRKTNTETFTLSGDSTLIVTNSLSGVIPTGIERLVSSIMLAVLVTPAYIIYLIKRRRPS